MAFSTFYYNFTTILKKIWKIYNPKEMSFYICKSVALARQQQHSNVKILSKHVNLPLWGSLLTTQLRFSMHFVTLDFRLDWG